FCGAAGGTYLVLHRTGATRPSAASPAATAGPSAAASPAGSAGPGASSAPGTPGSSGTPTATAVAAPPGAVATVRAYYAAINNHRYARAWRLGGRHPGAPHPRFGSGVAPTPPHPRPLPLLCRDHATPQAAARAPPPN